MAWRAKANESIVSFGRFSKQGPPDNHQEESSTEQEPSATAATRMNPPIHSIQALS